MLLFFALFGSFALSGLIVIGRILRSVLSRNVFFFRVLARGYRIPVRMAVFKLARFLERAAFPVWMPLVELVRLIVWVFELFFFRFVRGISIFI